MTPKRIPTRSGKPMFRYYLKTLIDKDDFDAIQPFITLPGQIWTLRANACGTTQHAGVKRRGRKYLTQSLDI